MTLTKKHKIGIGLVALCTLLLGGILTLTNPFKVTDPSDPRFDPTRFRFEDYSTEDELQRALIAAFPSGTSRSRVEEILIDFAQMRAGYSSGSDGRYFITYARSGKHIDTLAMFDVGVHQARIEYGLDDRVVSINSHIIDGKTPPKFFIGEPVGKGEKP